MRNLLQRLRGIWQEATAVFSPHPAQLFQAPLEKFYGIAPNFVDDISGFESKMEAFKREGVDPIIGLWAQRTKKDFYKENADQLGYEFVLPQNTDPTVSQDVPGKGRELFTVKIAKEDFDPSRIPEEEVEKIKQSLYGEDLYFRNWDGAGIRLVVDDRPTVGDRFTRIEQEVDRMVAIEKMQEEYPIEYINDFIKTRNVDTNLVSDGYHTFGELYEHRIELYMALCREWNDTGKHLVWRSQKHHDDSVWEGWFIMGVNKASGEQISYHLPEKYWYTCASFAIALDKAPEWDGHSSADVLKRLRKL
jgi:hypothetical protein